MTEMELWHNPTRDGAKRRKERRQKLGSWEEDNAELQNFWGSCCQKESAVSHHMNHKVWEGEGIEWSPLVAEDYE